MLNRSILPLSSSFFLCVRDKAVCETAYRRTPLHIPFLSLKKFSIKRLECPGPSTSNATTGNNAWSRGTPFYPLSPLLHRCTTVSQRRLGLTGDGVGNGGALRHRRKYPLIRDVPIMDVGLKGRRVYGFDSRILAVECRHIWFTSLFAFLDSFPRQPWDIKQPRFRGEGVVVDPFLFILEFLRHGLPDRNDFRLSTPSFPPFSPIFFLFSFRASLPSFLSFPLSPVLGIVAVPLRPPQHPYFRTVVMKRRCRPNKVWRDRWEKFLQLKSAGFSLSILYPRIPRLTVYHEIRRENIRDRE